MEDHVLHHHSHRLLVLLGGLALAAPAAAKPAAAKAAAAKAAARHKATDACVLQYQRADNMWAPFGVPSGNLGTETVTVPAGTRQYFDTDWKYEKTRNDGVHYYGSHLRVATNTGARLVRFVIRTSPIDLGQYKALEPGESQQYQADLVYVGC
jgi:hypothetical protein